MGPIGKTGSNRGPNKELIVEIIKFFILGSIIITMIYYILNF